MAPGSLAGRVLIVSPHLDDAVLSLGATIARLSRSGGRVEVLTVFAGDPSSRHPPNGWDRRGGYETEGAAAAGRRAENREACAIVGAQHTALTFSGGGYRRPRQPDVVWQAVAEHASGADAVLVPGFPLTNDDHAWLHELLLERGLPARKIVLYAEQPYRYVVRREPPSTIELPWGPTEVQWRTSAARIRDLPRKRRAILAYRSQLPLLGLAARRNAKLHLMLLHEAAHGGEATAELESRSAT